MRLVIDNPTKEDLRPFISDIVIPACTQILFSLIDRDHKQMVESYIKKIYNVNVNIDEILRLALANLIISKTGDTYQISINPNVFVPGINAKLYDICCLINFGNLEFAGYHIFDTTMERLAMFIPTLYAKYKSGG